MSPIPYTFTECAIHLPIHGGLNYYARGELWTLPQLESFVAGLAVSVSSGSGTVLLVIDREGPGGFGISDIQVLLTVGVNGIDPGDTIEVDHNPDLGIGDTPTLQELWDALDEPGAEFRLHSVNIGGVPEVSVQWIRIGFETYWFGTDADWFTDDPTCGAAVVAPPTKPDVVQTAVK